jgi:signal transduction histidine kinase
MSERELAVERESVRAREPSVENAVRLQQEDRIRALLERLVEVQERERRRLALNLHDHLGQQLTALKLTVGALKQGGFKGRQLDERLEQIDEMIAEIDREVDYLAWELRPAALGDGGLAPAMEEFVRRWSSLHRIAAEFHSTAAPRTHLPPEVESHLYRIVQEALNNVAKHAQAKRVSVLFEVRSDEVALIVEDDGRGFVLADVGGRSRSFRDGLGLTGMHERAAAADGSVLVESAPGRGTTVFVRIPIRKASKAR